MAEISWKDYFKNKVRQNRGEIGASDYLNNKSFLVHRRNTLKWLGNPEGLTILDAGCGVGLFSEPLALKNEVYGADFVPEALEYAAVRGLKPIQTDLTDLPFNDCKFDIVICVGVIQFIKDHGRMLAELARVLKPGGTLLVETLNSGSVLRKLFLKVNKTKTFDRMFDRDEMKELLKANGLTRPIFMNMYYPFRFVDCTEKAGVFSRYACTSFAIKVIKAGK